MWVMQCDKRRYALMKHQKVWKMLRRHYSASTLFIHNNEICLFRFSEIKLSLLHIQCDTIIMWSISMKIITTDIQCLTPMGYFETESNLFRVDKLLMFTYMMLMKCVDEMSPQSFPIEYPLWNRFCGHFKKYFQADISRSSLCYNSKWLA